MLADNSRNPYQVFAVRRTLWAGIDSFDQMRKDGAGGKIPKVPSQKWQVIGEEIDASASFLADKHNVIGILRELEFAVDGLCKFQEPMSQSIDCVNNFLHGQLQVDTELLSSCRAAQQNASDIQNIFEYNGSKWTSSDRVHKQSSNELGTPEAVF